MRRAIALLVSTVMVAGLALVVAAPAGAGGKKPTKFCKAVEKTDYENLGNPLSKKSAAKVEKQLNRLEKSAKGDTKDSVETLSDAYGEIADGESATEVFSDGDVISALATFSVAIGKCALSNLPDITLPDDIDIPDITLPDIGS